MAESKGYLVEIFKGIQGEGIYVGEAQLFLRFAGCNLSCKYCDTTYALKITSQCKIEEDKYLDNPIALGEVVDLIKEYQLPTISITGGEPLLQVEYLKLLLPLLEKEGYNIYLETNGTLPKQLTKILRWVNIISADLKLPSFSGNNILFQEHQEFLRIAKEKEVFVKVIVTAETTLEEVEKAAHLISKVDSKIPLILQPATKDGKMMEKYEQLIIFQNRALVKLKTVRIIPQIHKLMKWR
ncbi:7-carboxy-7-deazaguanine synthase QueE [bacterium]|nr:7-carboxy-7-deazaguanine synthase QueE [bacterium]